MRQKKILGIIGGMGPAATIYMFNKIVSLTRAGKDQDHIEIIVHNNTNIPDRTKAILEGKPSAFKELLRSAQMLERLSVDYIIIPCMTSHYYIEDLQKKIAVPIINALEETSRYIVQNHPSVKRTGLLATSGTIKTGLFQKQLEQYNIQVVILPEKLQDDLVMEGLYGKEGIKSGFLDGAPRARMLEAAHYLIDQGAEILIAGCTEIPLVLFQKDISIPLVDPMEVIAQVAISLLDKSNKLS